MTVTDLTNCKAKKHASCRDTAPLIDAQALCTCNLSTHCMCSIYPSCWAYRFIWFGFGWLAQ